jgi:hypothetical protein
MERQGNPAVKWGLIFGGLLLLVGIINLAIQYASGSLNPDAATIAAQPGRIGALLGLGCLFFLIEATLFFLAGMFTARENGRVGSAAIAGLIAGEVYAVIAAIVEVITLNGRFAQILPNASAARLHSYVFVITIVVVLLVFVFGGGIGAGIAALGGLMGRSQYERAHPAPLMEGSFYTPMAPTGGYPPAGSGQTAYPPTFAPPYPPNQSASYPPPSQPIDYPPSPPPAQ